MSGAILENVESSSIKYVVRHKLPVPMRNSDALDRLSSPGLKVVFCPSESSIR